jgi:hypothetical protein
MYRPAQRADNPRFSRIERGKTLNKHTLIALGLAAIATSSFAGRPLLIDDAGINDKGQGHVETWVARSGRVTFYNLSPAYAFWDNVELAAQLSRDSGNHFTSTSVQAKWVITPSQGNGCNVAASVGAQHAKTDYDSSNARYINGLLSCNGTALGSIHFNLGYTKPSGFSGDTSYGVALEKSFGTVTPHIEVLGSDSIDTSVNVGLRGDIAHNVQLDGSVGRFAGSTLYTLGLKFRF